MPDDPNDPLSAEYRRRLRASDAVQRDVNVLPEATPPNYPAAPPGQYGTESGILGTVGREAVIAANQAGIGVAGLPMGALNLLWGAGHQFDPKDFNEPPAWTRGQGPGSYGEALTIPGFNPMSPLEREWAAGARQAGSALPFVAAGAMGPIALGINALGGGAGQALTEAGHPNLGAAVQFGTGLGTGIGSISRMPGAPPASMWINLPRTKAPSAAEIASLREKNIDDYLFWDPITRWMGPGGLGVNYLIRRRNYNAMMGGRSLQPPSGATIAAQQILGGTTAGATIGTSSAVENAPPPISYSAPPSFAPRGGN